jgi:hypothetical protein
MEAQRHGPSAGKNASLPRESLDSIELPKSFQNVGDARAFQVKHYMDIPITAYADDSRAPAGDLVNLQGRADIALDVSKFSGVLLSAPKSRHLGMVFDDEGNLVSNADPGISMEDPITGRLEPIPKAALGERIRELGHFTCADPGVDQSFIQIAEECAAECDILARKKLLPYQLHQIIKLSTCQRIAHRARYSTTASLNKVQSRYFTMLFKSMHMHSKFPINLRFGSPKFGGLGLVSFDDMVLADRVTAIFRHHFRGGQESDILSGAIKRSELLHQSRTPILERKDIKLWDNTWIGRIAMSLSGSELSIKGGQTNLGFRADDVALADLFEEVRERRLVQEGCKKFGLHWFSQLVSEDGSTWADEIQDHKQHFNGSFSYPFYSVDGSGERTKSIHTVRSTTWLKKVKTALIKQGPTLGTYHVGCKPALREFDTCR